MAYLTKKEKKYFYRCLKELGIFNAYAKSRKFCLKYKCNGKRLFYNESCGFKFIIDSNLTWQYTGYAKLWALLWDEWTYTDKPPSEMIKMDLEPLKEKIKEKFNKV